MIDRTAFEAYVQKRGIDAETADSMWQYALKKDLSDGQTWDDVYEAVKNPEPEYDYE